MRKTTIFISISLILFLLSCTLIDKKESLTDQQIENYIATYTQLKEEAPEMLESINKNPKNAELGKEEYAKIEKIITNGGFNYYEFVVINAKVGSIFSIIQAHSVIENLENLAENNQELIDSGIAEIDKILNDPRISEEVKEEQLKLKEELLKGTEKLQKNGKKNEKWVKKIMKSTKKISGLFISEEDIAIVKKYEDKILDAYTGFQIPELPNSKFPKLNFEQYK